ncbi:LOW QUALITY PROTEIN: uncharacterized protein LOC114716661 [Neltuma alba]|uniref:LOW QUALITY PROTEIN: uncharacterized protein LOC114716661 n=1 Tax=Neltuma alba TaxID=207710 RepID=UPI0010A4A650|nr:LOW QUALITY PROTEIN: uncharacterized protein LOC114716661 [Prosopis alba]
MNKNGHKDEKSCCYFHPRQVVVGVCPLCLNERLLVLATKQNLNPSISTSKLQTSSHRKPQASSIHKIFAFGSLFSRPDSQHWKSQTYQYDDSSPSPEESFISIKFEKNGMASWEKNSTTTTTTTESKNKVPLETTRSVIEHGKSRDTLRWRRKIGHIFHLMRWKRPTKSSVEGAEGEKRLDEDFANKEKDHGIKEKETLPESPFLLHYTSICGAGPIKCDCKVIKILFTIW